MSRLTKQSGVSRHVLAAALAAPLFGAAGATAEVHFIGFNSPEWYPTDDTFDWGTKRSTKGDLNNDGRMDVVVTTTKVGVEMVLTQPDGSLALANSMSLPYVVSAELADFDDDGVLDLAALFNLIDTPDNVRFFKGVGDGTFIEMSTFQVGSAAYKLTTGDWNDDGAIDVAFTDLDGFVYLVRNDTGFQFTHYNYLVVTNTVYDVKLLDVTSDGRCDIIMSVSNASNDGLVIVMAQSANGLYDEAASCPVGQNPYDLCMADLNQDGHMDFITRNFFWMDMSVLLADGVGGWLPEVRIAPPTVNPNHITRITDLALGDLEGDGDQDLIVVGHITDSEFSMIDNRHFVFLNDGHGELEFAQMYTTGNEFVVALEIMNVVGDHSLDLVLINDAPKIGVAWNLHPLSPPTPFTLLSPPNGVAGLPRPDDVAPWSTPTLDWSDSAGFHRTYDVEITRLGANEQVVHSAIGLIHSQYEIPTGVLAPGRRYRWTVTARNAAGATLPSTTPSFEFTIAVPPDFNHDGVVNGVDLANLLSNWGITSP